ncbi:MAG: hypothetical protein ACJASV_000309 [Pseudorhodobacter sp.]|jgi:hypothetical protein
MEIELELGGFYTCVQEDLPDVVIWIGRVDLPDDLGGAAKEPVVSLIVAPSGVEGLTISHAPFWESFALDGDMMAADPFEVDQATFDDNYNVWRSAYDAEEAHPWAMTPNEVYAQMIDEMTSESEA